MNKISKVVFFLATCALVVTTCGIKPGAVHADDMEIGYRFLDRYRAATAPSVSALSYVILAADNGQIVASRDAHLEHNVASLTKLMTALIAAESGTPWDTLVTVSEQAASLEPSKMNLVTGEQITFGDLMRGMLIASANDAAWSVAEYLAGSTEEFVTRMNRKAAVLGMHNTQFKNPVGFDDAGQYSSAYDIALLSQYVLRMPELKEIVGSGNAVVYSIDRSIRHTLRPTNKLLGEWGVQGIKTGSTPEAGESLALFAEQDGKAFIVVLVGSQDRFADGQALLTWAYQKIGRKSIRWLVPVRETRPWGSFTLPWLGWEERVRSYWGM